jgi:uncharacterized protein YkwD
MRRARLLAPALVLAAALALPAPAPGATAAQRMFESINEVRREHGLTTLRPAPVLTRSSARYARVLLLRDRFAHSAGFLNGGVFRQRTEILALHKTRGGPNVNHVLRSWLWSRRHRAVLLDPRWRYLGVGVAHGWFGTRPAYMWVGRVGV